MHSAEGPMPVSAMTMASDVVTPEAFNSWVVAIGEPWLLTADPSPPCFYSSDEPCEVAVTSVIATPPGTETAVMAGSTALPNQPFGVQLRDA